MSRPPKSTISGPEALVHNLKYFGRPRVMEFLSISMVFLSFHVAFVSIGIRVCVSVGVDLRTEALL